MPTITTSTMFYLGNFADMDTDESDFDNENTGIVLGVHDELSLVDITNHDQDDDGAIYDNDAQNGTPDFISYDVGNGQVSVQSDSTSIYNAVVTLGDGSTSNIQVAVVQATNGDVFVVDMAGELDNLSVQSIELTSNDSSSFIGYFTEANVENSSVVCFASGTRIATPQGEILVEELHPGMLVTTLDHGAQPVLWVNRSDHLRPGKQAPISLEAGCLGPGVPAQRLRVSPQHRILLSSAIVERLGGASQMFAAAKQLLPLPGVTQALGFVPVQYHHFACARHEVVIANGVEIETFFAGKQGLKTLSDADVRRLRSKFPKAKLAVLSTPARPFLTGKPLRRVIARLLTMGVAFRKTVHRETQV